jgi:hypothetical protein
MRVTRSIGLSQQQREKLESNARGRAASGALKMTIAKKTFGDVIRYFSRWNL